jgi:predicted  nucleic acid-binding Zn-ribbon protein
MNKIVVDEEWYTVDNDKLVKQFLAKLDTIEKSIQSVSQRVEELHLKIDTDKLVLRVEQLHQKIDSEVKDTKAINNLLEELRVIKEREINALLREHIPFPFLLKNNVLSPMRRPFSSNLNVKL